MKNKQNYQLVEYNLPSPVLFVDVCRYEAIHWEVPKFPKIL